MRYRLLPVIVVCSSFSFPWVLSAQAAIEHRQFTVNGANAQWTPTAIHVSAGDLMIVLATGRVRIAQLGEIGPNGGFSGEAGLEWKAGAGPGHGVGAALAVLIAEDTGEVKLRVRSRGHDGNAGAFDVAVIHIPAGAIPEARGLAAAVPLPAELEPPVTVMKTDLRKLVTAEEIYFADSVRYTQSLALLKFAADAGVSVRVDTLGHDGYRASARDRDAPGWVCGIYIGDAPAWLPYQNEGEPRCWKGS